VVLQKVDHNRSADRTVELDPGFDKFVRDIDLGIDHSSAVIVGVTADVVQVDAVVESLNVVLDIDLDSSLDLPSVEPIVVLVAAAAVVAVGAVVVVRCSDFAGMNRCGVVDNVVAAVAARFLGLAQADNCVRLAVVG